MQTTTYFDFIKSVEAGEVKQVQFSNTEITYTKEDGKLHLFKTGVVDNPQLPQILGKRNRLHRRDP